MFRRKTFRKVTALCVTMILTFGSVFSVSAGYNTWKTDPNDSQQVIIDFSRTRLRIQAGPMGAGGDNPRLFIGYVNAWTTSTCDYDFRDGNFYDHFGNPHPFSGTLSQTTAFGVSVRATATATIMSGFEVKFTVGDDHGYVEDELTGGWVPED